MAYRSAVGFRSVALRPRLSTSLPFRDPLLFFICFYNIFVKISIRFFDYFVNLRMLIYLKNTMDLWQKICAHNFLGVFVLFKKSMLFLNILLPKHTVY
jgi:hypothetical protein